MNKAGFTLFEILTTIGIFSLGILVLAGTQVLSTKGTAFNREATAAASLAQTRIEELKETTFDALAGGKSTENGMSVSWSVAETGVTPYRIKDITVTVSWAAKSINLYTIVAE